jgi:hypothetical protein
MHKIDSVNLAEFILAKQHKFCYCSSSVTIWSVFMQHEFTKEEHRLIIAAVRVAKAESMREAGRFAVNNDVDIADHYYRQYLEFSEFLEKYDKESKRR